MLLPPVTCLNPLHFSVETRGTDMNVFVFLQPGDGIVFMAQTLEKLCQEKLTLMPKPECEAKGRKMSEDIEQHVLGQMSSSSLKCPQNPLIALSTWIFTAWEKCPFLLSNTCLNGDTVHFCLLSRRCNKAAVSGIYSWSPAVPASSSLTRGNCRCTLLMGGGQHKYVVYLKMMYNE